MKKKNKGNNNNNTVFNHVIYPKELSGYMLITLLVLAIPIMFLYLGNAMLSEKVSRNEMFWNVTAIVIMFLPSIYFVLSLYKLLSKKIYIEITQDYIKIKKTFRTHIVKISEIESIEEIVEYRSPAQIFFETKPTIDRKENITIKVPVFWFSSNDLADLIFLLRKRNKNIYYSTYLVYTSSEKRKPYTKDKSNK
ncbi:hypothetical protein [Clostridium sp. CF012]|uniref:hypothetical protein n=1 Tax=Clostridium sp. CF012 TaxID=2843319 RepID=UPI001C0C31CB|nr:hypothetical protein [Clostridium sp. CF012]MBU3143870.1 hypothetical protein [Clostridium sp. CF012]